MNIAGIVKSSFIDYPGCASTVIFLGGCNFNCGYCHNPEIVYSREGKIEVSDFLAFAKKRRRFVEAVCISGGEPTLYGQELYDLIYRVKDLGYKVKLDTNGTNPALLRRLLGIGAAAEPHGGDEESDPDGSGPCLVDHVAMDIKGPWQKYGEIAGLVKGIDVEAGAGAEVGAVRAEKLLANVRESLGLLLSFGGDGPDRELMPAQDLTPGRELASAREPMPAQDLTPGRELASAREPMPAQDLTPGRELASARELMPARRFTYELRTTVCRELLSKEDIQAMATQLAGAECWYLQTFKQQGELLDAEGVYSAYSAEEMEALRRAAEALGTVKSLRVR